MPAADFNPTLLHQAVAGAAVTKDIAAALGRVAGRVVIRNSEGDPVFYALGTVPGLVAGLADGVGQLNAGQSIGWNDVFITTMTFITAGPAAEIEIEASAISEGELR